MSKQHALSHSSPSPSVTLSYAAATSKKNAEALLSNKPIKSNGSSTGGSHVVEPHNEKSRNIQTVDYASVVAANKKKKPIAPPPRETSKKTTTTSVPARNRAVPLLAEQNSHDIDECNVFVKYLPVEVSDDASLGQLFAKYGNIISSKVMIDSVTNTSLGYGFVRFSTPEEASQAITAMNGFKIGKKTLLCKLSNKATASTTRTPTANTTPSHGAASQNQNTPYASTNLYIKHLPPHIHTEEQLRALFDQFGPIAEAKVIIERATGLSKQIAFVRFEDEESAREAIAQMNGRTLDYPTGNQDVTSLVVKYAAAAEKSHPRHQEPITINHPHAGGDSADPRRVGRHGQSPDRVGGHELHNLGPAGHPVPYPYMHAMDPTYGYLPVRYPPYYPSYFDTVPPQYGQVYAPMKNSRIPSKDVESLTYSPDVGVPGGPVVGPVNPLMLFGPSAAVPHHEPAMSQPYMPSHDANLFVFHLPSDVDDQQLYHLFSSFGPIESVKVISDRVTGESKGYGFVKYFQLSDAVQAITAMNGFKMGKKHLKVSFKTSQMANHHQSNSAHTPRSTTSSASSSDVPVMNPSSYHSMNFAFTRILTKNNSASPHYGIPDEKADVEISGTPQEEYEDPQPSTSY